MDPSLSGETPTMPSLTIDEPVAAGSSDYKETTVKQAAVVITEGLPPVSTKLLEKIQKWEFIELASLLTHDAPSRSDTLTISQDGRSMILRPQEESLGRKKINDIPSWIQAFSIYTAALAASEKTSSDHFKGLMAHMYLMIQIARDLEGSVWLQYDREFRIWAAAKGVKVWGELNLSIYGRCLAANQKPPSISNAMSNPTQQKRPHDKKGKGNCCYKWNFDGSCRKPASVCRYLHVCHFCGEDHRAMECPSPVPKFSRNY